MHPSVSMGLSSSEINSTCIYSLLACLFNKLSKWRLVCTRVINGAKGDVRIGATRSEMDILINWRLQKYNRWTGLPSSEISPEGGKRVYFGDIWKIIVQANERQAQRFWGRMEHACYLGTAMGSGSWKLRAKGYFCCGCWRRKSRTAQDFVGHYQKQVFTLIEMSHWFWAMKQFDRVLFLKNSLFLP